ncbi:hypothetical protein AB0K71_15405 [Streptomyces syringium]|uniref:hypothetical protein n=1 Tax=Streptomyces syringium TaxID=76729 RepID=UPI003425125B
MSGDDQPPLPDIGALMLDARRERVGEVMDVICGRVLLRDPAGGREWEAFPCDLRPATTGDELRARVAHANDQAARSRL